MSVISELKPSRTTGSSKGQAETSGHIGVGSGVGRGLGDVHLVKGELLAAGANQFSDRRHLLA